MKDQEILEIREDFRVGKVDYDAAKAIESLCDEIDWYKEITSGGCGLAISHGMGCQIQIAIEEKEKT